MEEDLENVAGRIGLDRADIKNLKRRRIIERISIPVVGAVITVISLIIGLFMGSRAEAEMIIINKDSYPFAGMALLAGSGFFKRNWMILLIVGALTAILSYVAYTQAFEYSRPYYEAAIAYGVYDSR